MHNGALIKNRTKIHEKIVLRIKLFQPQKYKSRQCIDCTFRSNASEKGKIKHCFPLKRCAMVLWWRIEQKFIKKSYLKKTTFLAPKIQVETVYTLYFLEQRFGKRPNQAVFSAKKWHNDTLMQNRTKILQNIVPWKKTYLASKMQIKTVYTLYF